MPGIKVHEIAENASLNERDAEEFLVRLDAFYETLTDTAKAMLATLVVEALAPEDSGEAGGRTREPPTAAELEGFAVKLTEFHDALPGDQHLYVDEILAKTWFKDDIEVEGYRWVLLDRRYIPASGRWIQKYRAACYRAGGDRITWPRTRGDALRISCWDWRD